MKNKIISKLMSLVGMGQDIVKPFEKPERAGTNKKSKPRFNAGDRFYQFLSFKRINGKWRVKR